MQGVDEVCGKCKYQVEGECRRYPAMMMVVPETPGPVLKLVRPQVDVRKDSCGEFVRVK